MFRFPDIDLPGQGAGNPCLPIHPWRWRLAGTILLVVVLIIRSWHNLAHCSLFMEDAALFSRYYGGEQPAMDMVARHFNQPYITLLSNFFSWIYAFFDVRLQPCLYQWTGFVWGVAAATVLFYSGLIRSRVVLLLGPLLMGLTALNHVYYYITLIYVMYTAVILLLALLLFPDFNLTRKKTVIFLLPLVALLPWAGPYSVLVVPVALLLLVLFKMPWARRMLVVTALFSAMFYFFSVQGSTVRLAHLKKWWVVKNYFQVLLERIVFFGLFDHVSLWFWLPVLLLVALSLFLLRSDTAYLKNSLVCFALITGSLALFFLSIKFPLYLFTNVCHRVISLYFWSFFLLYTADRFLVVFGCRKTVSFLFAVMLVTVIVADNIRHPKKRKKDVIAGTKAFTTAVKRMEDLHLEARNRYVILELESHQGPFFNPRAVVGSRRKGAKQLGSEALPPSLRTGFIVEQD